MKAIFNWMSEKRKIDELLPSEYNPRQLSETQKKLIEESLKKFNLSDPIIINKNNKIIGGHQRIKVLKEIGIEEVDVRVPDVILSDEDEKELNLRLNKNTGDWDFELLANFNEEMLSKVGFSPEELDNIFNNDLEPDEKDDQVPEVRETDIKLGDMFQLGEHRLLCGDATKKDDVEKLMHGEKADMVFTDPPYNQNFSGGIDKKGNKSKSGKNEKIKNDSMSKEAYKVFFEAFFRNIQEFTNGGWYICFYRLMMKEIMECVEGWRSIIIWKKNRPALSPLDYHNNYEPIIYGYQSHKFAGDKTQSDVWEFPRPTVNDLHPTMKPVELCAKAVCNSSWRDGSALDLFGGSGSTLIACEKTNRKCRMMELDPVYCQVIIDRWEDYTNKKAVKINN